MGSELSVPPWDVLGCGRGEETSCDKNKIRFMDSCLLRFLCKTVLTFKCLCSKKGIRSGARGAGEVNHSVGGKSNLSPSEEQVLTAQSLALGYLKASLNSRFPS